VMPDLGSFLPPPPWEGPPLPKTLSVYKDIQHGRTRRGSLISKINNRVHLEIISHEDMEIMGKYLEGLHRIGIPYEEERKKVYSPIHKGYVYALVIEFDDKLGLPPLPLEGGLGPVK